MRRIFYYAFSDRRIWEGEGRYLKWPSSVKIAVTNGRWCRVRVNKNYTPSLTSLDVEPSILSLAKCKTNGKAAQGKSQTLLTYNSAFLLRPTRTCPCGEIKQKAAAQRPTSRSRREDRVHQGFLIEILKLHRNFKLYFMSLRCDKFIIAVVKYFQHLVADQLINKNCWCYATYFRRC